MKGFGSKLVKALDTNSSLSFKGKLAEIRRIEMRLEEELEIAINECEEEKKEEPPKEKKSKSVFKCDMK